MQDKFGLPAKLGVAVVMASLFGACGVREEVTSLKSADDKRKVWVFVQINVPEEEGMEDYYYYARMSHTVYAAIKRNELQRGFLFLDDVRYYGDDEKYHFYADEDEAGELVFRIEDIRKIDLLKKPPTVEAEVDKQSTPPTSEAPAAAA